MGTRSRIGITLKDQKTIASVYCHYDGYPSFNGKMLKQHFNTESKVRELIDGGDISSLWTNAGWNNETLPETGPLYYSSRGEDCPPETNKDAIEFLVNARDNSDAEYCYIFKDGEWVCWNVQTSGVPLREEIPT